MQRFLEDNMLSIGTKTICVRVGSEPKHEDFTVHEELIKTSSKFIAAALGGSWKESEDRMIKLPTCHPKTFRLYVQWLYTARLHSLPSNKEGSKVPEWLSELQILTTAYILGDYIQDTVFKDTISDAIVHWGFDAGVMKSGAAIRLHRLAYEAVPNDSPLRRLISNIVVWGAIEGQFQGFLSGKFFVAHPDFLKDVVLGLASRLHSYQPSPLISYKGTCHYHSHGEETCYKTKQNDGGSA